MLSYIFLNKELYFSGLKLMKYPFIIKSKLYFRIRRIVKKDEDLQTLNLDDLYIQTELIK
jgi:hypothetical protein